MADDMISWFAHNALNERVIVDVRDLSVRQRSLMPPLRAKRAYLNQQLLGGMPAIATDVSVVCLSVCASRSCVFQQNDISSGIV